MLRVRRSDVKKLSSITCAVPPACKAAQAILGIDIVRRSDKTPRPKVGKGYFAYVAGVTDKSCAIGLGPRPLTVMMPIGTATAANSRAIS
jgi:hypothetical protein